MTVDFNDYFWGEKNNGFDVLYHNMKYGLVASKELSDFFREKSNIEEHNSKLMTKLANKAGSGCVNGTFAPVWIVLKSSAERLASLHLQMVQKITELVKDVAKYADELGKKHKQVKEEEAGTLEAVQAMQSSTVSVQKSKDLCTNRMQELEKLRKDNGSHKDLEKIETKLRKQQDDYKLQLEKHNPIKMEFEQRMATTCKKFQEMEENHLKQMKEFLSTYIELLQNNHDMVGQVHSEFKRQFLEMTVDKLLEQFVLSKYTGLEKPEMVELDMTNWSTTSSSNLKSTQSNKQSSQQQLHNTTNSSIASATIVNLPDNTTGILQAAVNPLSVQMQSQTPLLTNIVQQPASSITVKKEKEPYLRNWFNLSSASSSSAASSPAITAAAANTPTFSSINHSSQQLATTTTRGNLLDHSIPLAKNDLFNDDDDDDEDDNNNNDEVNNVNTSSPLRPPSSTLLFDQQPSALTRTIVSPTTTTTQQSLAIATVAVTTATVSLQSSSGAILSPPSLQPPQTHILSTNLISTNSGDNSDKQNIKSINNKEQQQQQKSSRRTTSLLNLFMSNSQVSAILRSGRSKTKAKKVKNKKKDAVESTTTTATSSTTMTTTTTMTMTTITSTTATTIPTTTALHELKNMPIRDGMEINQKSNDIPFINANNQFLTNISATTGVTTTITSGSVGSSGGSGSGGGIGGMDVDEDGYSVQPKERLWETERSKKEGFYSDSDSDSDNDERDRKIRVEIKPLNNNAAPISASVDELRATVENLSLSPICGVLSSQHQSPAVSNSSTPTAIQSMYNASMQSPTLFGSSASKYTDLGDIFSEVGEISASVPSSATTLNKICNNNRQIPTPTSATIGSSGIGGAVAGGGGGGGNNSNSSIAIPRPPSRRSEAAVRGRISPLSISRADSVGSLEFRTASIGLGSSRGPSPLTIGKSDTIPIAVAFHEIVHAFFKGNDESRCQVKINGDMMLSFPSGVVSVFANNPNPAKLGFRIKNAQNLENILPNKQLVLIDKLQSTTFSTLIEFNMPALTALLRRQSEQNPMASYFNVDILKYQVRVKSGAASCPFQLVSYWKCEQSHTDIKIDYKYNSHAMSTPSPLLNVAISIPVDGDVKNVQSKPHSVWMGESNRLVWNFTDISQHSDNNGVDTLRARLEVNTGPSNPAILSTQFNCEGTTLSGIEFELAGTGYRLSLVKRRFISGKYICETESMRTNATTPTPPIANSPNPYQQRLP